MQQSNVATGLLKPAWPVPKIGQDGSTAAVGGLHEPARLVPGASQAGLLGSAPNQPEFLPIVLRLIQMIGELPLLHIYVIQALKLIKIFEGVLLGLFYIMMNCIGELLKICCSIAWMMIKLECPWAKSMKVFVIRISRL